MADLSKQTQDFKQAWYDLLSQLVDTDGGGDISSARYEIIGAVKVKIDEMMPEGEGVAFEVADNTNVTDTLDLYINQRLDDCANILHQRAPLYKIIGKNAAPTPIENDPDDGTGYVVIPSDFIRLQSFKMTGWLREVSEYITPDHPDYKKQFTVLKGKKAKPVLVRNSKYIGSPDPAITDIFEYYSLSIGDTHTLEKFIYVPTVVAENVQANLQDALTWICAKEILQITGRISESERAELRIIDCFNKL
jgi:hypothetical protein